MNRKALKAMDQKLLLRYLFYGIARVGILDNMRYRRVEALKALVGLFPADKRVYREVSKLRRDPAVEIRKLVAAYRRGYRKSK